MFMQTGKPGRMQVLVVAEEATHLTSRDRRGCKEAFERGAYSSHPAPFRVRVRVSCFCRCSVRPQEQLMYRVTGVVDMHCLAARTGAGGEAWCMDCPVDCARRHVSVAVLPAFSRNEDFPKDAYLSPVVMGLPLVDRCEGVLTFLWVAAKVGSGYGRSRSWVCIKSRKWRCSNAASVVACLSNLKVFDVKLLRNNRDEMGV